uniref:Uncharacterized protein n=1 Tax=Panagrolaimus sp. PS1159 TaxID=55785 RepID=A0AC35FZ08_9BILA
MFASNFGNLKVHDLAEKQALQKQKKSSDGENFNIIDSIKADLSEVFKIVKFHKMKETFLMEFVVHKGIFLSADEIKAIYDEKSCFNPERRFKLVYELAEKQSKKKQELSPDANFNLIDSIRANMAEIIPTVNFGQMTENFLMDFVAAKGFLLYPAEFAEILYYKGYHKVDFVYELAEKQALKKQEMFPNENFNLTNSIKADLSRVISNTEWYKMKKSVLMDFFVAKGIITKEQASHVCDTRGNPFWCGEAALDGLALTLEKGLRCYNGGPGVSCCKAVSFEK